MLRFNRWQTIGLALLMVLAAYVTIPNFISDENPVPGLPDTGVTLGLDLQGGSYLLLGVGTEEVIDARINNIRGDIPREMRKDPRVRFIPPQRQGDAIVVGIPEGQDFSVAVDRLRRLSRPLTGAAGRDLRVTSDEGARQISLELTPEAREFYASDAVTSSITAVRNRIDALGTTEPTIQRQGEDRLVLQVPGDGDSERLKSVIGRTGQLSFHMVDDTVTPTDIAEGRVPPRRIVLPNVDFGGQLALFESPDITGDMITDASASPNSDGGGWQVNFAFDGRGQRRFADVTRENLGRRFAIVLDEQIISAPTIQTPILGGSGRITGRFAPEEATELAILIKSGALPAPLTVLDQRTVGASLGADSVRAGTIALLIGFGLVIVYMAFTYGRFGLYADIALLANVLLISGALSLLGATLTLPGIAGIVLTIGMAVDANVLIFERIREEMNSGKASVAAVESGYKNALSAIIDANLTTLIAAFIMFTLGSGPVRGFAVTLGIGVITSVFTAFVITRVFAGGYVLKARPKTLAI
ncbi:protein translocase subunit SecD [Parvularcula sp. ZS-1/3]|uniref:Protein translocase subunit SecD n=1 Tax=Parvularcula mediterranea TaxID=2732508 RepID=A0A7Y3RJ22_9PROT|nr:protein translocase subunit SecD [Parvularcula mediterranea]NNU14999.1 protein translocase subunit SecD [Parvularcula mediterranea]